MRRALFTACLVALVFFGVVGCKLKQKPDETVAAFRARAVAIRSAQAFAGLEGWGDSADVLQRAGKLGEKRGQDLAALNERVRLIGVQVTDAVQAGKPKDAIAFIEKGLAELETAEQNGVFKISDPNASNRFYSVITGVRIGLQSLRAVIEATKEPGAEPETGSLRAALAQTTPNAPWWNELIAIGERVALRMVAQQRMETAEAWADVKAISARLAEKNKARLGAV